MDSKRTITYGLGDVERKNSEGYQDPTVFEALSNIKKEERVFRPLVYICSPYSGDTEGNTKKARDYCRFAVMEKNAIAFAPHLLLPQYLNDEDPKERELALFMDAIFLGKCHEVWVFGETVTEGMQREIDRAKRRRMTIRYFNENMKETTSCD